MSELEACEYKECGYGRTCASTYASAHSCRSADTQNAVANTCQSALRCARVLLHVSAASCSRSTNTKKNPVANTRRRILLCARVLLHVSAASCRSTNTMNAAAKTAG